MRALLAEDDAVARLLLETVLAECGHEVMAMADGAAAWSAFERAPVPLVVLDWQMPGLDGLEVCRRIRAGDRGRATFVLVVTSRDGSDDLRSVLDAGADDYLAKPILPEHLRARLVIAERHLAVQRARTDAELALHRAQWLAGIGETTLALQHEINNPLAALLGYASLLETDPNLPAPMREGMHVIVEQARRIRDVVQRLAALRDPQTREYLTGRKMIDLSGG